MDSNPHSCATTVCLVLAMAWNALLPTESLAERVGYTFEGTFIPISTTAPPTYKLFGVTIPNNSPITGTFSYDTSAPGVEPFVGAKAFSQTIQGGFNFNILNAVTYAPVLQLSASEYTVTVADDYTPSNAPSPIDYLSVEFNSLMIPTPIPIMANGANYGGATAYVNAAFSWDADTFGGPDEPKLHADLPRHLSFLGNRPNPITCIL